ncbi:MAG: hypothetical protein KJZ47_13910 [Gemmatimonadales bacterium]|nr:hypothetical protein [Gemmatimonadales bacterium]
MQVHTSDAQKILDALDRAAAFFSHRDEMNAAVHLATQVRYSPLTSEVEAARDRLRALLLEPDQ